MKREYKRHQNAKVALENVKEVYDSCNTMRGVNKMELLNISTTMRNPNRALNFLEVLKELDCEVWNKENQKKFQILLIQRRQYTPRKDNLSSESINKLYDLNYELTYQEAQYIFNEKKYKDPPMRGRTSFSPLKEFGFATIEKGNIKITDLGNKMLREEIDLSDLALKWGLKWQFPNPISSKLKKGTDIRPLVAAIHFIDRVNKRCIKENVKAKGISKNEFSMFILSLMNYKDISEKVEDLFEYRRKLSTIESNKNKQKFYNEHMAEYLNEFSNFSKKNVNDYSDNVLRYFLLSDLFKLRGNGYYIDLSEINKVAIDWILAEYDGSSDKFEIDDEYLNYLCDFAQPVLGFEEKNIKDIMLEEVKTIAFNVGYEVEVPSDIDIKSLKGLKKKYLNIEYKINNLNVVGVDKVIEAIKNIRNLEMKPSIALEYWISKGLMLINDAKEIRPNYLTDSDNNIIFTALGKKGDIECYYDEFNTLCEVTLLRGRDQWYNEGQPVMRHLKDFKDNAEIETFCLFVAPYIHRDTLNTFWTATKYEYEGEQLKIIPITIANFVNILEKLKRMLNNGNKMKREQLRELYTNITDVTHISSSDDWSEKIDERVNNWVNS